MKAEKEKKVLFSLRQHCQKHGLRVTPKRVLIYEELMAASDHPTPEMLLSRVRAKYPDISLDTVYRTLATFHEIGLVGIVEGFSLSRRYDPNQTPHHHARCTQCQKILDFDAPNYDQLEIPGSIQSNFDDCRVRVTIEGRCKRCQQSQTKER